MTSNDKLYDALTAVDWNLNVENFLVGWGETSKQLQESSSKIAHWAKQLEKVDLGNPALCFIREAQISVQYAVSLIALGLYKPSAMCARTMVESLMYYTFFMTHREELQTLVRDNKYYITKVEIIDYHNQHTSGFKERANEIGLKAKLDSWYSEVSGILHGQIPGKLVSTGSLSETAYDKDLAVSAADLFSRGVEVGNLFLLATIGPRFWQKFSPNAKSQISKGLTGEQKGVLEIDTA